jgi:hypothetical protein
MQWVLQRRGAGARRKRPLADHEYMSMRMLILRCAQLATQLNLANSCSYIAVQHTCTCFQCALPETWNQTPAYIHAHYSTATGNGLGTQATWPFQISWSWPWNKLISWPCNCQNWRLKLQVRDLWAHSRRDQVRSWGWKKLCKEWTSSMRTRSTCTWVGLLSWL